jgi:divinyl chlorophyllide a 8-vinyl-reductase
MLFRAIGKEPKYSTIPIWIFNASIHLLQWLANLFQNEQLENAAELGRIGKYYAVEDMVETDNRFGSVSLQDYFNRIAVEGQEYDPYTSMYVSRTGGFSSWEYVERVYCVLTDG